MKIQQSVLTKQPRNLTIFLGIGLILTCLLFNKWSLERIFAADEYIASNKIIAAIVCLQLGGFILGLWLLFKKPRLLIPVAVRYILLVGLIIGILLGGYGNLRALNIINPHREMLEVFRKIHASEELILKLTPKLQSLNKSVMNLQLPDNQSHELFEEQVTVVDLADSTHPSSPKKSFPTVSAEIREWRIEEREQLVPLSELQMWRPLLERIAYFEHAKFRIKKGHFLNESHTDYETVMLFHGTAYLKSGQLISLNSTQVIRFRKQEDGAEEWQSYDWRTKSFRTTETNQPLFAEVLDYAIPNPQVLKRARRSIHQQLVLQSFLDKQNFKEPHKHFTLQAFDRHPGVSVVDLDRDGFDDLYVMARWGENLFFHNLGNGTFEEIAADIGLNIKDHSSSAIFADFDNDGDTDVFLGRTLKRCVYLINENGQFVNRSTELVDAPLPYFASSVTAVDYNRDGLLDIYVSTYDAKMLYDEMKGGIHKLLGKFNPGNLKGYLSEADSKQLGKLMNAKHMNKHLNRPGPPNVLLKNIGDGQFTLAKESPTLRVFRNTYQSTWSDYDGDGDLDVYLANDFAPNNLLRNEGNGEFTDVSLETGTTDIGFGMGASWGDYDNDGKQDLYVSNMYSKAGRRITAQVPRLDPRIKQMSKGNSLFRNMSGHFDKISGLEPPSHMVENGGWGWGSQFVDVDNNGYLDIYALSGYYTAPKEIAIPVDT